MGREPPACPTRHWNPMNRKFSLSTGRSGSQSLPILNRTRRQPNGFTLMELLIVISIILILMLMAIPTIGNLTKKGNDTSAINSVQTITKAEIQYNGYACTLAALGGDPNAGAPTPAAAQILQGDLVSGYKSGYIFTIACKDKVTINGTDRSNGYVVTAVPQTVGKTGDRGFCSDQFGSVKYDAAGGTNCTQNLQ